MYDDDDDDNEVEIPPMRDIVVFGNGIIRPWDYR